MLRRVTAIIGVIILFAGVLLGIFEVSGRRMHVLPADASPLWVLVGALLGGIGVSAADHKLRQHHQRPSSEQ